MSSDLKEIGVIVLGRGVNDKGLVRDAGVGVVCVGGGGLYSEVLCKSGGYG